MTDYERCLTFSLRMPTRYGEFEVSHFEFLNSSNFAFAHQHNCYEIYYTLSGAITITFANKTAVAIPQNHCLILAPETFHTISAGQAADYFILGFSNNLKHITKKGDYDAALFLRLEQGLSNQERQTLIQDQFNCAAIIEQIGREYAQKGWAYKLVLGNLCSNLLFLILRNLPTAIFSGKDMQHYPDDTNMALLISKYIADQFSQPLSLESVAGYFHISPRHVNRLLDQYYGQTFNDILNAYRLEEAKKLLTATHLPLEEIAYLIGFSSSRSLYNLFAKYENLSPLEYKKLLSELQDKKTELPNA